MSETTINAVTPPAADNTAVKPQNQANSILNAFKQEFATAVVPIYVNSLNRTVNFREVTVQEQKTLSKTMIQNENRRDIVYDAQCAMINRACLEDGFDIYKLTEFDRIRILMDMYATNFMQKEQQFKCPECGTINNFVINFDKISQRFNEFDISDKTCKLEDRKRYYNFTMNYPTVYNISSFYKNYQKKYKNASRKEYEVLDNMSNIEYLNLFIKSVELVKKEDNSKMEADFTIMSFTEIEQLMSMFPQTVIFDDKSGIVNFITNEFIDKMNKVFQREKCGQCGYQMDQGLGDVNDFL